ncbi:MAG TPA: phenylalanine--tRNA ligase subunit beta [Candidatus Paceibacterota bacterium]|nr:phenylalanine--tRNA ligase subunit beta [Candidatus Paceibacterota bacterium]
MKVSYKWLSGYFDKKLPSPDELAELLSAHAFEVEGIEKLPNDTVLDVKVLPDRAHYALSHGGIAGEVSAITGIPESDVKLSDVDFVLTESILGPKVTVSDEKLCRRYIARRIESVMVKESSPELRSLLEAIGARSINNIVDITNYVMMSYGQPMHAFDADKLAGSIVVRLAKAGEKIIVLDGREIELRESDLVIADDQGPIAIAGVKGGKRAEVTSSTKNIVLESANFDPASVRRTSTRANLRNDSSKRFENEITPVIAFDAMRQATKYILESCPGAQAGELTDIYPEPAEEWLVSVDPEYMNAVTGLSLSTKDMEDILIRLGCKVQADGKRLAVTPPPERLDLTIPEDIADEIVRIYGYDKLPSKDTPAVPRTPSDKTFYWTEFIKNALMKAGYSELQTYTLVKKGYFEIAYPLASDKAALRESIKPKFGEALQANALNADFLGLESIKAFEIGKVFPKTGEKTSLCVGVLQVRKRKDVTSESLLKEIIAVHEARFGKLEEKIETGPFGAMIEIDLDPIIAKLPEGEIADLGFAPLSADKKYVPFSAYPYIVRDIAMFVPGGTNDAAVLEEIRSAAEKSAGTLLVKGPALFDRFEKDGKISYAFRMIFQAFDRTLSDDEANAFMKPVYDAVIKNGWTAR